MSCVLDRRQAHIDAVLERHGVFTVPNNWAAGAPCIGKPDAMFFPERRNALALQGEQICATCPKHATCLLDALDKEQHLGVFHTCGRRWLSAGERRTILAGLRVAAAPVADAGDDVSLMLALCGRIAHNLNQDQENP